MQSPLTEKEINNLDKREISPHNALPVVPATPPSVPPSLGSTPSPPTEKLVDGPMTNHVLQGEKSTPLVTGKPMAAANVRHSSIVQIIDVQLTPPAITKRA